MTNPEKQANNSEYLNHYPNAIQDSEEAHAVANAGKRPRDYAYNFGKISRQILDWSEKDTSSDERTQEVEKAKEVREQLFEDFANDSENTELEARFGKAADDEANLSAADDAINRFGTEVAYQKYQQRIADSEALADEQENAARLSRG